VKGIKNMEELQTYLDPFREDSGINKKNYTEEQIEYIYDNAKKEAKYNEEYIEKLKKMSKEELIKEAYKNYWVKDY
jgi:hypothetical protein